jgi:peptidylprolyl isomerase
MKFFVVIVICLSVSLLAACGNGSNDSTAQTSSTASKAESGQTRTKLHIGHSGKLVPVPRPGDEMSKREIAKLPKLTIARQSGPPPKQLETIDLRKGWGTALTKNDAAYVRYYVVSYPEALERSRTGRYGPRSFGLNEAVQGWEDGLPGMKVGGRRELILPPRYVYPRWKPSWGYKPYVDIYLIDLLAVERGGADQTP